MQCIASEFDQQLAFLKGLDTVVPRISIESCEREQLSSGLWKLTAVVKNEGLLPLLNRAARRSRAVRPANVRLQLPSGATLVAGRPQVLVRGLEGSGDRVELEWLVLGPDAMELGVTLDSDFTGEMFQRAEVKQ